MSVRLSLDIGFSSTKVAVLRDGVLRFFKEQNAVCKLGNKGGYTGDEKNIIEFNGDYYLVGLSALQFPDSDVINDLSYDNIKLLSPLVAKKYMRDYNLDEIEYVSFSLSSAFLNFSQDYKEHMIASLGLPEDKVKLAPQGATAKVAIDNIGLDVDDPSHKDSYKNFLIIDIGYNTIDVANVIDGSLMPSDIKGYEHVGACLIAEEVQASLKKNFALDLSLPRVRNILETKVYKKRDKIYDCHEIVQEAVGNYFDVLHNFLEDNYADRLDAISNVIFLGGGAELIKLNKEKFEQYDGYGSNFVLFPTIDGSATFYNAIGACYLK
jgi:hypothetical protein